MTFNDHFRIILCSFARLSRQRRASFVGSSGVARPCRDDVTRHTTLGRARKTANWPKPDLHARKYNDPFVTRRRKRAGEIIHGGVKTKLILGYFFLKRIKNIVLNMNYFFIKNKLPSVRS